MLNISSLVVTINLRVNQLELKKTLMLSDMRRVRSHSFLNLVRVLQLLKAIEISSSSIGDSPTEHSIWPPETGRIEAGRPKKGMG